MSWLTNWNRRKLTTVNGSTAGAQSDYQMKLTVNQGSGTDVPGIIYCGGNIKDDFSDLRFTDSSGLTELSYWIESITGTSGAKSAIVWIKIGSIPASPSTATIYVYYNKPVSTTTSTTVPTFIREISGVAGAWNLNGDALDRSGQGNNGTVYGMTYTSGLFGQAGSFNGTDNYTNMGSLQNNVSTSWGIWMKPTDSNREQGIISHGPLGASGEQFFMYSGVVALNLPYRAGGISATVSSGIWSYYVVTMQSNTSLSIYKNGVFINSVGTSNTQSLESFQIGSEYSGYGGRFYGGLLSNIRVYSGILTSAEVSDLYGNGSNRVGLVTTNYPGKELVRKYASPEPTFSTTSTEQTSPNITATSMTITKSENPCRTGICTVTIVVRWSNSGGTDDSISPNITIDTIPQAAHTSRNVVAGSYIDETFIISGLTAGTYAICPDPN